MHQRRLQAMRSSGEGERERERKTTPGLRLTAT
jgi:hypothetical protein